MEQNDKETNILDSRTTIKKSNLKTIYFIVAFSIIIQLIITMTGRPPTGIRRDTLLIVLTSLGGAFGLCLFPIIIAFLYSWKNGIYNDKFRKVFVISWIIILVLFMIGKLLP